MAWPTVEILVPGPALENWGVLGKNGILPIFTWLRFPECGCGRTKPDISGQIRTSFIRSSIIERWLSLRARLLLLPPLLRARSAGGAIFPGK